MDFNCYYKYDANDPKCYRAADTIAWIQTATADEIVDQFIDRYEANMQERYNGIDARDNGSTEILQVFLDRANREPAILLAWNAFVDDDQHAPHACINFDGMLREDAREFIGDKSSVRIGEIGRLWFRELYNQKKEAAEKHK